MLTLLVGNSIFLGFVMLSVCVNPKVVAVKENVVLYLRLTRYGNETTMGNLFCP